MPPGARWQPVLKLARAAGWAKVPSLLAAAWADPLQVVPSLLAAVWPEAQSLLAAVWPEAQSLLAAQTSRARAAQRLAALGPTARSPDR